MIADNSDFPVQDNAVFFLDCILNEVNECFVISSCSAVDIDHKSGVFFRYFNAADAVALKAGVLNQLACEITGRTLKDTAA